MGPRGTKMAQTDPVCEEWLIDHGPDQPRQALILVIAYYSILNLRSLTTTIYGVISGPKVDPSVMTMAQIRISLKLIVDSMDVA